ncbi:MAG TPA: DUF2130 domain-containing protein [Nitrospinota bacterium]|nr:DUF2130 domain-containing protein [Nitrospinota bacterium]
MSRCNCPLCKQEVSKSLYEKITGVWEEKEKRLADLKNKEKKLLQREKSMKIKFEEEKKKITAKEQAKLKKEIDTQKKNFQAELKKEKEAIRKREDKIQKDYQKKIAIETNKILKQEKARREVTEKMIKEKFELSTKRIINKEKTKLQKEKNMMQKRDNNQMNKYKKLNQQFITLQSKSTVSLEKANKKIISLEEQIRKSQTPQMLGLLEEGIFLDKLKSMFPRDKFKHPGKGGDLIHHVYAREKEVGLIVYELKKVSTFSKKHIIQAFEAKQQRNADYGLLVTNAKRGKDDAGFFISKGVIVIHPSGAIVLVSILREHIIQISQLKLSKAKRAKVINSVLDYIQSPSFRNSIENIMEDTKDLYISLTKEVKDHIKSWELRLAKYRNIYSRTHKIETNAVKLLLDKKERKALPEDVEITAISLPSEID